MGKLINLVGQEFGRLTVVEHAERDRQGKTLWKCKCDCGEIKTIARRSLISGDTKSCGCIFKEIASDINLTHGMSETRLFKIWIDMRRRCTNPRRQNYKNYGARGITVCEEWLKDFLAFYNWSIINGYKEELTIDRIDVDGNYEPSNCRWVTMKKQNNNRRNTPLLEYKGEVKSLAEWAEDYEINYYTLRGRIIKYNWTVEKALTTPVKNRDT